MELPVINIRETDRLAKAMQMGTPFYISDKKKKLLVPVPDIEDDELNDELKVFDKDFLISALEESERCTTYISAEESMARLNKIIHG